MQIYAVFLVRADERGNQRKPGAFPRSVPAWKVYLTRVKMRQVFNDADSEEVTHIDSH